MDTELRTLLAEHYAQLANAHHDLAESYQAIHALLLADPPAPPAIPPEAIHRLRPLYAVDLPVLDGFLVARDGFYGGYFLCGYFLDDCLAAFHASRDGFFLDEALRYANGFIDQTFRVPFHNDGYLGWTSAYREPTRPIQQRRSWVLDEARAGAGLMAVALELQGSRDVEAESIADFVRKNIFEKWVSRGEWRRQYVQLNTGPLLASLRLRHFYAGDTAFDVEIEALRDLILADLVEIPGVPGSATWPNEWDTSSRFVDMAHWQHFADLVTRDWRGSRVLGENMISRVNATLYGLAVPGRPGDYWQSTGGEADSGAGYNWPGSVYSLGLLGRFDKARLQSAEDVLANRTREPYKFRLAALLAESYLAMA